MLSRLRDFFAAPEPSKVDDEATLHLAAAALLLEIARADHTLDSVELDRMKEVLARKWGLGEDDLADLVEIARDASETSVSLHRHIDAINSRFSAEQKFELVRGLWQVAVADREIHHHEEALVRRLADLMYVPHRDFIRAKLLALDEQGMGLG
jgi:uncharacterized tellurite resistance protein B-like protein